MAYDQHDNSGSLFRNQEKNSDKHPDYTGRAKVDGVEYWISAWIKQAQNGSKYMSIAFKPKQATKAAKAREEVLPLDDEVPF